MDTSANRTQVPVAGERWRELTLQANAQHTARDFRGALRLYNAALDEAEAVLGRELRQPDSRRIIGPLLLTISDHNLAHVARVQGKAKLASRHVLVAFERLIGLGLAPEVPLCIRASAARSPAARYSEDIDLVQIQSESIGDTLDLVRGVLDPWLGTPQRKLKEGRVNFVYRFESEDNPPIKMRLKLEINSREHFTELGLVRVPLEVDNQWFRGRADVATFAIDELLGTKLRALYQRRKGRDLFDLWFAIDQGVVDAGALIDPGTLRGEPSRRRRSAEQV